MHLDLPHRAYILLRRAQINDALGHGVAARELYAQFLKLWSNPNPELQPIADQARARLAALQRAVD